MTRFPEGGPRRVMVAAVEALHSLPAQVSEVRVMTAVPDLGLIPGACDLGLAVDRTSQLELERQPDNSELSHDRRRRRWPVPAPRAPRR